MLEASSHRRLIVVAWFSNFITAIGMMAMVPYLTFFVEELGVEKGASLAIWSGVVVGTAPIVAAFMGPIWGTVGDRSGRRKMVLRALLAISIFVGLAGLSTSPWFLLAMRFGQGMFSGYIPATIAWTASVSPPERQGRIAGLLQSSQPAGATVGYVLGGFMAEHWGARSVFPVCAALAAVGFASVLIFTTEGKPAPAPTGDSAGGVLRRVLADARLTLASPALASLLIALAIVRGLVSTVDPLFARFVEELGGTKGDAGLIFASQAIALLIGMIVWGRLADSIRPSRVVLICGLGLATSFLLQSQVRSAESLHALRFAAGFFLAGIFPAAYGLAGREAPPERRGNAMGIVFLCVALSHAIGSLLGGPLVHHLGFRALLVTDAALIAVAASFTSVLAIVRRRWRAGNPCR
ncbi:MAG: MFS transporter [Planctomycetes bacterium]|nr:MFS transporter [Planctomycetota bacterium]